MVITLITIIITRRAMFYGVFNLQKKTISIRISMDFSIETKYYNSRTDKLREILEPRRLLSFYNIISVVIAGCCSRSDYTQIEENGSQPIDNLDVEHINIKYGYCNNDLKKKIFHVLAICMLGVPYLIVHWSIRFKLFLLMTPCFLSTADFVLVTVSKTDGKK